MRILNGIILCGGKSSRMGKEKGLLKFNGKTLMDYAIEILKPHVNDLLICSNNMSYEQFGFPVYADIIPEIGPVGGIYSGLTHSDAEYNLVISCDMPFIDHALIELMIHSLVEGNTALVPIHNQKIEPLVAIYSQSFKSILEDYIQKEVYKLYTILNNDKGVHFLDIAKEITRNNKLLLNINSPDDFRQFLTHMR